MKIIIAVFLVVVVSVIEAKLHTCNIEKIISGMRGLENNKNKVSSVLPFARNSFTFLNNRKPGNRAPIIDVQVIYFLAKYSNEIVYTYIYFGKAFNLRDFIAPFFKKCEKTDTSLEECLTKSANDGWLEFIKGDATYNIASMSPLKSVSLAINVNDILKAELKNGSFAGYEGVQFKSVNVDLEKKRFDASFTQPVFNMNGDYEISGKILDRPIEGIGFANCSYLDATFNYFFEYELKEKKGKHFIDIKNSGLTLEAKKLNVHLDNLFGGDAKLGEDMNAFLNKNWDLAHDFIKAHLGQAIGKVYSSFLSEFFKKVSIEELF